MNNRLICLAIVLLSLQVTIYGQKKLFYQFNKSVSLSVGATALPRINEQPLIVGQFFNHYGPSISSGFSLNKVDKSILSFSLRYVQFGTTRQDTVILSPINPDPNSYNKYFGFENSKISLLSIGIVWQRNFGQNEKNQPYLIFGGELLYGHRNSQYGTYASSAFIGTQGYSYSPFSVSSINAKLGSGLRHKLSDRFFLFEQIDASYMLIDKSGFGVFFSPLDGRHEILFNFSVGLIYNLTGTASETDLESH